MPDHATYFFIDGLNVDLYFPLEAIEKGLTRHGVYVVRLLAELLNDGVRIDRKGKSNILRAGMNVGVVKGLYSNRYWLAGKHDGHSRGYSGRLS